MAPFAPQADGELWLRNTHLNSSGGSVGGAYASVFTERYFQVLFWDFSGTDSDPLRIACPD
jgi:hypothetical protein